VADPTGFLRHGRQTPPRRPVFVRLSDWREVYEPFTETGAREQAGRCMDCGIPFCQSDIAGCPLANRIPDFNNQVRVGDWRRASETLHSTNNFPEFTGRLCPAPCEAACVLARDSDPVTIEHLEKAIADRAWEEGWLPPRPPDPSASSGRRVAVIGSGPAGMAAAQQLRRAGHEVVLYERDEVAGGLLVHGIPDFKMEKRHVTRRLEQLVAEGVEIRTGVAAGVDITGAELRASHDAVLLAVGAPVGRELPIPGRELSGVHLAMEYLVAANRTTAGRLPATPIPAEGRHVVIIGGGDTAADCLGTAHRQGAASVTQLDIYPEPPPTRDDVRTPWPTWPLVLRTYPAHEEGGERRFAVSAQAFTGTGGNVRTLQLREVTVTKDPVTGVRTIIPAADKVHEIPCDLALLAIGFDGAEESPLLTQLGVDRAPSGAIACGPDWQTTATGVFTAGDAQRGASLVVWAIADGRAAAAAIDRHLRGTTNLPAPVRPADRPLAIR
jgi:glutamate synthase (NADPH/NADH) small chain